MNNDKKIGKHYNTNYESKWVRIIDACAHDERTCKDRIDELWDVIGITGYKKIVHKQKVFSESTIDLYIFFINEIYKTDSYKKYIGLKKFYDHIPMHDFKEFFYYTQIIVLCFLKIFKDMKNKELYSQFEQSIYITTNYGGNSLKAELLNAIQMIESLNENEDNNLDKVVGRHYNYMYKNQWFYKSLVDTVRYDVVKKILGERFDQDLSNATGIEVYDPDFPTVRNSDDYDLDEVNKIDSTIRECGDKNYIEIADSKGGKIVDSFESKKKVREVRIKNGKTIKNIKDAYDNF